MKFGIMVRSLGMSQMSYFLIKEMNRALEDESKEHVDPFVFYDAYDMSPIKIKFSCMQHSRAWNFKGPLIATDITTAEMLCNIPNGKKYFYVWDMEWLFQTFEYKRLANIFLNEDLELIARNESCFNLIEKSWKTPSTIIREFDYESIKRVVKYGKYVWRNER